jgi:hypothetical protein
MVEITIDQAKEVITEMYKSGSRDSIILLGRYGIGKTTGINECFNDIAESMGKKFILYDDTILPELKKNPSKYFVLVDFALTQCEPSDLTGIPRDEDGYIMYKPLGWAVALSICSGALFLDEISNVQRLDVQSVMLKLFLEKKCGFVRLNKDTVVIAAGNKKGRLVAPLPEAILAGRVVKLEIDTSSIEDWAEYMVTHYEKYDRRVTLFLRKFGNLFNQEEREDAEEWTVIATPRSWTKLANMSAVLSKKSMLPVAEGLVGRAAVEFQTFINTKTISIDSLADDLGQWRTMTTDQKYFAVLELMNATPEVMFTRYNGIMDMFATKDREFLIVTLMMMDAPKRQKVLLKAMNVNKNVFNTMINCAVKGCKINNDGLL